MQTVHRFVFEHRRPLATGFAVLATLSAISSLRSTPDGALTVVAVRDLPSGTVVAHDDVRRVRLPHGAVPHRAFSRAADVVGRRVAGPMRSGEPLTDRRLLEPGGLEGYGKGAVLSTVRVSDADGLVGVRVGDVIDVVAVDPTGETAPTVAARGATVALLPDAADDDPTRAIGLVTSEEVALRLAAAGLQSRFSVMTSAS